ncbi:MAG: heme o synthase [Actinomycetota bacterium]
MNRFQKLASTTTVLAIVLVFVGALVRATGSGLGCPDWPRCHGQWIPPMEQTAIIEYSHRLAASIVGFLVLALAITAWLKYRSVGPVFWPAFAALVTVIIQAGVGRQVVLDELHADLVVLHFFLSLALVGLLTFATVSSFTARGGGLDRTSKLALFSGASTFLVLMVGAAVVQSSAGLAFSDWPLMDGSVVPPDPGPPLVHYLHRILAALLGGVLAYQGFRLAKRDPKDPQLLMLGHGAFALWIVQVAVGGTYVLSGGARWTIVAHVLTGELLWVAVVALAVLSYRRAELGASQERAPRPASKKGGRVKAYFMLTKPRIIELLLITTVPAMIVAEGGWPPGWLVLATLLGGSLAAGSANAINCYFDRDIDQKMARTAIRPLPTNQVEPRNAAVFGVVLGVVSLVFMTVAINFLAAALASSAILFYVFVYTIGLKRSTPSNIVIGGAAGAAPALVGWAAVTNSLHPAAWVLFAIIFYWTPPHFWALALRYSDEYEQAGVPMLPVVQGVDETTRQIVLYSVVLLAVSLLMYPVAQLGVLYLGSAVILGGLFTFYSIRLRANPDPMSAMGLFKFSISYLVLLFSALAADRLIGTPALEFLYAPVLIAAAVVFVVFSSAVVVRVVGYRQRSESPGRVRELAFEVVWTLIPLVMMGGLFVASW